MTGGGAMNETRGNGDAPPVLFVPKKWKRPPGEYAAGRSDAGDRRRWSLGVWLCGRLVPQCLALFEKIGDPAPRICGRGRRALDVKCGRRRHPAGPPVGLASRPIPARQSRVIFFCVFAVSASAALAVPAPVVSPVYLKPRHDQRLQKMWVSSNPVSMV